MGDRIYNNMIKSVWKKGDKEKHSHLIIVVDTDDKEFVKTFVKRDEDIKDVLFKFICNPIYEIMEIYNFDMDLEEQLNENKAYHIKAVYNRMDDAYKFAEEKHEGQTRENGNPYISHPLKVAELIKNYFSLDPRINELITAAYLHDTVEDTNTTIDEIKKHFGEYVAYLVNGVTNDEEMKHEMGKTNYLCYKMLAMDEDILNLKLCDRLANILDLNNAPSNFVSRYETETIVIMNYLLNNRKLSNIQREIVKDINTQINTLRRTDISKSAKQYYKTNINASC